MNHPQYQTNDELDIILRRRGWLSARTETFGTWCVGDADVWCAMSAETAVLLQTVGINAYEVSLFALDTLLFEPVREYVKSGIEMAAYITELEAFANHPNTDFIIADPRHRARMLLRSRRNYDSLDTSPFDPSLDTHLRSRGWWSFRRYVEGRPGSDLLCDQWRWGPHHNLPGHHLTIACVGRGHFEAEIPRAPHALADTLVEHFADRRAVLDRVVGIERLLPNAPVRY